MDEKDLLKLLRDGGLDDEAIKELVKKVLVELGEAKHDEEVEKINETDEEEDKEKAGKLLGVTL